MDKEIKRQALANYLEVELEDVVDGYSDDLFECNGDEYRVLTDTEADEAVVEEIESIVDDLGLEAFTPAFQDWIVANAVDDPDWFDDALRESEEYYVDDLTEEDLLEELMSRDLITEDDVHYEDDDEDHDYPILNDNLDLDRLKDDLIDELVDEQGDAYEWYVRDFGEDSVRDLIKKGTIGLDCEQIAEEGVRWDSRGHYLSPYDGQEIELEFEGSDEDLYAYQTN